MPQAVGTHRRDGACSDAYLNAGATIAATFRSAWCALAKLERVKYSARSFKSRRQFQANHERRTKPTTQRHPIRHPATATAAQAGDFECHFHQHVQHDRHRAVHHGAADSGDAGRTAGPPELVCGALVAICDGLVVSELGASLPSSGGAYVFLRDSYGRERWGKLMAWMFIWQFLFSGHAGNRLG